LTHGVVGETQVVDITPVVLYLMITESRLVMSINRNVMLLQQFLPEFFTFPRDSALAHRALEAINFSPITLPNVELFQTFFHNRLSSNFLVMQ